MDWNERVEKSQVERLKESLKEMTIERNHFEKLANEYYEKYKEIKGNKK